MDINNKALAFLIGLFVLPVLSYARDAVDIATEQIGKMYADGGNGPQEFDCSGLTWYAFGNVGIEIDLTANSQYTMPQGTLLDHPRVSDLQRGDLIFFETDSTKPGFISHVGIYEGNDMMINAMSEEYGIQRSDWTSSYWSSHFRYARRMPSHDGTPSSKFTIGDRIAVNQDNVNP